MWASTELLVSTIVANSPAIYALSQRPETSGPSVEVLERSISAHELRDRHSHRRQAGSDDGRTTDFELQLGISTPEHNEMDWQRSRGTRPGDVLERFPYIT